MVFTAPRHRRAGLDLGRKFPLAEKASQLMARYPELVDSMARVFPVNSP